MKAHEIETELKNYKIRQGYLFKRSRVLREWRKRWIVLTINFLFSFQSQECQKATEAIELKEVISFKTFLRNQEDSQANCFYIQTKTVDFAFSTKQTHEKWSWIVSLQRLFDFKERGASSYNNIDQIKTEGFPSQQNYQLLHRSNIKATKKIINASESDKKKQMKAQEMLSQLNQRQQKLNKREEELLRKERQLQKIKKISKECSTIMLSLSQRIKELQEQMGQFVGNPKPQFQNFTRAMSQNFPKKTSQRLSPQKSKTKQSSVVNRYKCIQYLFDQFNSDCKKTELQEIVTFLTKINSLENSIYRQGIRTCLSLHNNIKNFVMTLIQVAQNIEQKETNINQTINLMALAFQDQTSISLHQFSEAEKVIIKYCNFFSKQTSFQLLNKTSNILLMIIEKTKGTQNEDLKKAVNKLQSLSQDPQYKKQCQLIIENTKKDRQK